MKSLIKELKEKFDDGVDETSVKSNNKELIKEEHNHLKLMMEEKLATEPRLGSSPSSENLFGPIEQLQGEIQDKDKIIEGLTIGLTKLKNQISIAEKEKSDILEGLKKSKWLENKVALVSKKLYEDKIKSIINENADSKLIPVLTDVARRKQGNQQLNWDGWLKIPENGYLFQVNEDIAKKIFENTNALIGKRIVETQVSGGELAKTYALAFSGDGAAAGGDNDHVKTDFNPNDYDLNLGFTVSYWVRPDIVGAVMFAMGWKGHNKNRFTFGINKDRQIYIGVGGNDLKDSWVGMGVDTSLLEYDGSNWILKTDGTWYHFAVKYADRTGTGSGTTRKVYLNGTLIKNSTINWSRTSDEIDEGMYFGGRNAQGSGTTAKYDNGWACAVSQVAIYDTEQSDDWPAAVYNAGRTGTDFTGQSNLVGYWKFNEGSGITVTDHSENGNHGTFAAIGSATNNSSYSTVTALPTWSGEVISDTP